MPIGILKVSGPSLVDNRRLLLSISSCTGLRVSEDDGSASVVLERDGHQSRRPHGHLRQTFHVLDRSDTAAAAEGNKPVKRRTAFGALRRG